MSPGSACMAPIIIHPLGGSSTSCCSLPEPASPFRGCRCRRCRRCHTFWTWACAEKAAGHSWAQNANKLGRLQLFLQIIPKKELNNKIQKTVKKHGYNHQANKTYTFGTIFYAICLLGSALVSHMMHLFPGVARIVTNGLLGLARAEQANGHDRKGWGLDTRDGSRWTCGTTWRPIEDFHIDSHLFKNENHFNRSQHIVRPVLSLLIHWKNRAPSDWTHLQTSGGCCVCPPLGRCRNKQTKPSSKLRKRETWTVRLAISTKRNIK